MSAGDFIHTLPVLMPLLAAMVILVLPRRGRGGPDPVPPATALAGLFLSVIAIWRLWQRTDSPDVFGGAMRMDAFALYLCLLAIACTAGTVLMSVEYLKRFNRNMPEFHVLVLFACVGMMVMVAARDLLTLLLGLEVMSLALYVLAGFFRDKKASIEAAAKYFLTGSFATGLLLFGIAFIYGGSGSFSIDAMGEALTGDTPSNLVKLGCGFLIAGFAFKVAAAPFHMWLPDVYDGAPTTVTGFMATGVKVAAFGALVRVFAHIYQGDTGTLRDIMWWLAVATMTVGNVAALAQRSVKRMLAYSSISHAGYLIVGLVAMVGVRGADGHLAFTDSSAVRAILYYLLAYVVTNIGAFAVLSFLERDYRKGLDFDDMAGLRQRFPVMAFALSVFMLSLAGIPGTAGFIGKFLILEATVESAQQLGDESFNLLAVLAIINSLVGLYYYLRVPINLYAKPLAVGAAQIEYSRHGVAVATVVLVSLAGTLWWGFGPDIFGFGVEPALELIGSALGSLR